MGWGGSKWPRGPGGRPLLEDAGTDSPGLSGLLTLEEQHFGGEVALRQPQSSGPLAAGPSPGGLPSCWHPAGARTHHEPQPLHGQCLCMSLPVMGCSYRQDQPLLHGPLEGGKQSPLPPKDTPSRPADRARRKGPSLSPASRRLLVLLLQPQGSPWARCFQQKLRPLWEPRPLSPVTFCSCWPSGRTRGRAPRAA